MAVGQHTRRLVHRVAGLILRAIVDRTKDDASIPLLQVRWFADRVSADVEHRQGWGVYFRPQSGAEGILLSAGGDRGQSVFAFPYNPETTPAGGGIAEGEGGLHYLGEWRVFLDSAGAVNLGAKSGAEFVALGDKVLSELDRIKGDLDTLKAAIEGASVAPNDGGAQLKTTILSGLSAFPTSPSSVAAQKAKAT